MFRKVTNILAVAVILCCALATASAATLSSTLSNQINKLANSAKVGIVIISFNTTSGLNASHLLALTSVGITKGITFPQLGMVAAPATVAQVKALAAKSNVRSIWSNDQH